MGAAEAAAALKAEGKVARLAVAQAAKENRTRREAAREQRFLPEETLDLEKSVFLAAGVPVELLVERLFLGETEHRRIER
jgi:hypothetical protein